MRKRKRKTRAKTLSPPFDYWFLATLFLSLIFLGLLILLIKERLFLQEMKVYLEKYKISLNNFFNFNAQFTSHLLEPTNPSSSTNLIYLQPERFTLKFSE